MTPDELRTLRGLTARLVPGPPEDPDPGALEAGAAEAIAALLDSFEADEPPIHAARDGGFVPLDPVAELGWRRRVTDMGQRMSDGLAMLDERCRAACEVRFADASTADQDSVLDGADASLADFVAFALSLTLDAVYGSPAYGGNRDRVGWRPLGWPGFTQPRGFSPAEVSEPDGE